MYPRVIYQRNWWTTKKSGSSQNFWFFSLSFWSMPGESICALCPPGTYYELSGVYIEGYLVHWQCELSFIVWTEFTGRQLNPLVYYGRFCLFIYLFYSVGIDAAELNVDWNGEQQGQLHAASVRLERMGLHRVCVMCQWVLVLFTNSS